MKRINDSQFLNIIASFLQNPTVPSDQKAILRQCQIDLQNGVFFMKVIKDFKLAFAPYAMQNTIHKDILSIYTEIIRQNPNTSGDASIFNFLMRDTKD